MADSKLSQVKEEVVSLKSRLKGMRHAAEKGIDGAMSAAAGVGTGAALGLAAAYNSDKPGEIPEVSDVPISVVGAVVAYAMAMTTKKDRYQRVFESAGAAAAGVASFQYFVVKGKEWKEDDETDEKKEGINGRSPVARTGRVAGAYSQTIHRISDRMSGAPISTSRLPAAYVE